MSEQNEQDEQVEPIERGEPTTDWRVGDSECAVRLRRAGRACVFWWVLAWAGPLPGIGVALWLLVVCGESPYGLLALSALCLWMFKSQHLRAQRHLAALLERCPQPAQEPSAKVPGAPSEALDAHEPDGAATGVSGTVERDAGQVAGDQRSGARQGKLQTGVLGWRPRWPVALLPLWQLWLLVPPVLMRARLSSMEIRSEDAATAEVLGGLLDAAMVVAFLALGFLWVQADAALQRRERGESAADDEEPVADDDDDSDDGGIW